MPFYTYLLASRRNGTLYVGSTDDVAGRMRQHREAAFGGGFTARYGVAQLVWIERHPSRDAAFRCERQIKEWRRAWKLRLVEGLNPEWVDLAVDGRWETWVIPQPGELGAVRAPARGDDEPPP